MNVIKSNGKLEPVKFDKITARLKKLCDEHNIPVNPQLVSKKVIYGMSDNMHTSKIDELAAEYAVHMQKDHPGFEHLAKCLVVHNLHKDTQDSFYKTMNKIHRFKDASGKKLNLLDKKFFKCVEQNRYELDKMIDHRKDYNYDYFGIMTFLKQYLTRLDGVVVERPQHALMRIAVKLHKTDLEKIRETYETLSDKFYTHASPTIFNSGMKSSQLLSCFLLAMNDDSIDGIYDTLKECAKISQNAGGIGFHISNIRGEGAPIGYTGTSDGIVPMLKVYNDTARYVNQKGKRKGSFAAYIEPHHPDILKFARLRRNNGDENSRARDLFYAIWLSDCFMKCVDNDEDWYLIDPHAVCHETPLENVFGQEYEDLYKRYVSEGKYTEKIKARKLWDEIQRTRIETGIPYLLNKDAANQKTNQNNLEDIIKSSNLCAEIMEMSNSKETACCTLASMILWKYVSDSETPAFNFDLFREKVKLAIKNLNIIVDENNYVDEKTKRSNMRHRPLGLGVQGLADVFMMLGLPFCSDEAKLLNKQIFEHMYYAALEASMEIAMVDGPYETYKGCNVDQGKLQFDLWGVEPVCPELDWAGLRAKIAEHGIRNSLLIALMPTASTSHLNGSTQEAFEPLNSNMYVRRTLSGDFVNVNRHLIRDLSKRKLWNSDMFEKIKTNRGSVQNIDEIPADLKEIYKTAFEMQMRDIIDMSADRGAYVCQSQSLNLWISNPDEKKVWNMAKYAWKKGLKTMCYYLRTKPAADAQAVTSFQYKKPEEPEYSTDAVCRMEEGCIMCSG